MDWLNNANTIASLILATIGIGGYAFGIMTYLKKKASPAQPTNTSQATSGTTHKSSGQYQSFTLLEWAEFFGQGVVDTADFILHLCFQNTDIEVDELPPIGRIGGCLFLCFVGGAIGLLVLGGIISLLFTGLGILNGGNAATAIGLILLLTVLSFVYVYHVGLRAEQKRQQQYRAAKGQQHVQQATQR